MRFVYAETVAVQIILEVYRANWLDDLKAICEEKVKNWEKDVLKITWQKNTPNQCIILNFQCIV